MVIKQYAISYVGKYRDSKTGKWRFYKHRGVTFDTDKKSARKEYKQRRTNVIFVYRVKEVKRK